MSSIQTLFHEQFARLIGEGGPRGRASGELTALPGGARRSSHPYATRLVRLDLAANVDR